jgi:NADH-quinone oxidoreductase subunit D
VLAIEKLLELEVPPKATWMRMLLCELNRIHSHLVFLGTSALELGAISMFWYCFRERDMVPRPVRARDGDAHAHALLPGRRAGRGRPRGFEAECRKFVEWMPKALDDYEAILSRNEIWLERTRGIGLLSAEDAIALGQSGPCCARRASTGICAATGPYLAYPRLDFNVPSIPNGDVYDRYLVRMDEMRESVRIIEQCLDGCPRGRGSRTTARWCSRRGTSCTPRWSR